MRSFCLSIFVPHSKEGTSNETSSVHCMCVALCPVAVRLWGSCRAFYVFANANWHRAHCAAIFGAGADGLCHPGCCADERAHAERKGDCEAHRNGKRYAKAYGTPKPTVKPTAQQQTQSKTVYITDTGEKYHRSGCQYLRKSKHAISLSEAKSRGYTPCSKCKP